MIQLEKESDLLAPPLNYNPDVLSCLANLSNDEVFTPPKIANDMLDMLPQELFRNPDAKFLDPVTKSGVFLREITKRLMAGLADTIQDRQKRLDHILHNQVYGIAITELTSLIARRTLYCAKYPNCALSISKFDNITGNIRFKNIQHTWKNGRCVYCGAAQSQYERSEELESHAYEFIHTDRPQEIFGDMKFDVIIGNPPYQLSTGGSGAQAKPLYDVFIEKSKQLDPKYLAMIIPSRWFAGGMSLDKFRDIMKSDKHIRVYCDYINAKECFPQNSISGGVGYFLRDTDYSGLCTFNSIHNGKASTLLRYLSEFPTIIRYNQAVTILRKVYSHTQEFMNSLVSPISPFGISTKERGANLKSYKNNIKLYSSKGCGFISFDNVVKGKDLLEKYKVMVSQTGAEHAGEPDTTGAFRVLTSSMMVLKPNEACTHSYILLGRFDEANHAQHLLEYLKTKFARFLILLAMSSIHLSKITFSLLPIQDFSKPWTDAELYKKYGLDENEINFIESMIKPMELPAEAKNG